MNGPAEALLLFLASVLPLAPHAPMNRLPLILAAALVVGAAAQPARAAELRVRLSRSVTGRYESVGVTVTDPQKGLDARPGPLTLTMADGADRRQTLFLEPTGRPGEWYGRFTPFGTGRYTGTVVLERTGSHDLGLVPLVRVRPSKRSGFLRLHPSSGRLLKWTNGGGFFPVGVRLSAEDLRAVIDWRAELARLRARGVNYLEAPVIWPGDLPDAERVAAQERIDGLLLLAERVGGMGVQLDLMPPADPATNADAYEEQLAHWVRRWSYSTALAMWNVAGAGESATPELCSQWVRAVRAADSYGHPIALPGVGSERQARGGADLQVLPVDGAASENRFAILEAPEESAAAALPGETSWRMLAIGGIGLPVQPYRPGNTAGPVITRLGRMAAAAHGLPLHLTARVVSETASAETPGSFCRYGPVLSGWTAANRDHPLRLQALPKGRYRARYWDPAADAPRGAALVWSDGQECDVRLPAGLQAVYFQLAPTGAHRAVAGVKPARKAPAPPKAVVRVKHPASAAPVRPARPISRRAARKEALRQSRAVRRERPARMTRAEIHAMHRAELLAKKARKAAKPGRAARALSTRRAKRASAVAKPAARKRKKPAAPKTRKRRR